MSRQRKPPTTVWGTLSVAADLLEASPGLARLATIARDYRAGKLSVPAALQDALWITPNLVPHVDCGIPQYDPADRRCALYWAAMRALDEHGGGSFDTFAEAAHATTASVAAIMREVAATLATTATTQSRPPEVPAGGGDGGGAVRQTRAARPARAGKASS